MRTLIAFLTELPWHPICSWKNSGLPKMSLSHAFVRLCSLVLLVLMVAFSHHSGLAAVSGSPHQCENGPSHHPEAGVTGTCCQPTQCVWVFPVPPVLPNTFALQHGPHPVGIQHPFVITRSLYPPPKPGSG